MTNDLQSLGPPFVGFAGFTFLRRPRASRPFVRARILKLRLCPGVVLDTPEGMYVRGLLPGEEWDGRFAAQAEIDGTVLLQRSGWPLLNNMRREMVLMLHEHCKVTRTLSANRLGKGGRRRKKPEGEGF